MTTAAIALTILLCSATFDRLHGKTTQEVPNPGDNVYRKVVDIDYRDAFEIFCGLQRGKFLLAKPRLKILLNGGCKIFSFNGFFYLLISYQLF